MIMMKMTIKTRISVKKIILHCRKELEAAKIVAPAIFHRMDSLQKNLWKSYEWQGDFLLKLDGTMS